MLWREERERRDLHHLAAEQVDRELRSRHVRDEQVVEAAGEAEAAGAGKQCRWQEVLGRGHEPRSGSLVAALDLLHACPDDAEPVDRVTDVHR
jgi:hypothetical protein